MQIDRHNYEDFFLLALDGEISAAGRESLDKFLALNPDLLPEFEMLKQTVLPAEDIRFDKTVLFKRAALPEGLQEDILRYADGELSGAEERAVKQLLFENTDAADFRRSLKLSTLSAEEVVCPFKEELYRRESARVLPITFLLRAAAVIVLLLGTWLVYNRVQQNGSEPVTTMDPVARIKAPAPLNENSGPSGRNAAGEPFVANAKELNLRNEARRENAKQSATVSPQQQVLQSNNNNIARVDPVPVPESNEKRNEEKINVPDDILNDQKTTPALAVNTSASQPDIIPANSITYLDEQRSDNKILYMDESDLKRSKAGGLFKKVKRFVARAAEIRPGKSFGIASLKFGPDN